MKKRRSYGTVKRILVYAKPYAWLLVLGLVFAALQITATLLAPVVIGDAIDYMIGESNVDFSEIFYRIIALLVLMGVAVLSQWLSSLCTHKVSLNSVRDIRAEAFDKLNRVPLKTLDSNSHGDIMTRVSADVDQISDGLLQGFTQIFSGVVTIIGTLIFMLYTNGWVALTVVVLTPISILAAWLIAKGCHNRFREQAKLRGDMSGLTEELIGGQKTVKAFGYEPKAEERFEEINTEIQKVSTKAMFASAMTNPVTRFVNGIVYAAVTIMGALFVINPAFGLTVGGLSIFLSYANQYAKPFNEITGVVTELQTATSAARRVFEILDYEEEPSEEGKSEPVLSGDVEIKDVNFSYTDAPLIENFSLSVKKGSRVAIVGPTGCGKTTLINLLMRFYEIDSGYIGIDGISTADMTREALRRGFGMVLQESWLFNGTVAENIAYGKPDATREEIIEAAKKAHIHKFITKLGNGYDTVLTGDGDGISQGQRQLLCIARIMLTKPPMLILDEATSNIDTRTEIRIQKAFAAIMEGRTSFIVAHRLSTIKNADVILVMKNGNVIEKGSHAELIEKRGFYYELYNAR